MELKERKHRIEDAVRNAKAAVEEGIVAGGGVALIQAGKIAFETKAIKAALGERAGDIPVSSTKSSIGHLLGAAGAVEAIATVEALRRRQAPPTVNWEEAEEGLDLDYVPGSSKPIENGDGPLVAISNSFGFGGHNAVLVLEA